MSEKPKIFLLTHWDIFQLCLWQQNQVFTFVSMKPLDTLRRCLHARDHCSILCFCKHETTAYFYWDVRKFPGCVCGNQVLQAEIGETAAKWETAARDSVSTFLMKHQDISQPCLWQQSQNRWNDCKWETTVRELHFTIVSMKPLNTFKMPAGQFQLCVWQQNQVFWT